MEKLPLWKKIVIAIMLLVMVIVLVDFDCKEKGKAKCFEECMPGDINATLTCQNLCDNDAICVKGNIFIVRTR